MVFNRSEGEKLTRADWQLSLIHIQMCIRDRDEHCSRIDLVLSKLQQNNITLKIDKSKFITQRLPFLGYILSETGITPSPEKVEAIQNFPKPRNVRQLQSFLGICNYYRKFQQNYSELTAKFQHILSSKNRWKWGKPEDNNFQLIKTKFLKSVILHHPDFQKRFYLNCDASNISLGVELYQEDEEDNPKRSESCLLYTSRCV